MRPRLLRTPPDVFLGADARGGLSGQRGLLYGEKRYQQVDVLGLEPAGDEEPSLASLVEQRFQRAEIAGWRVVGLAVRPEDLTDAEELLLDGLVAGDVLLAGSAAGERIIALVHCGDRFDAARLPVR